VFFRVLYVDAMIDLAFENAFQSTRYLGKFFRFLGWVDEKWIAPLFATPAFVCLPVVKKAGGAVSWRPCSADATAS
jgi:hypothetical protein